MDTESTAASVEIINVGYPVTVSFAFLDISKAIRGNRTLGGNIKTC
jgi:hypothetical protein